MNKKTLIKGILIVLIAVFLEIFVFNITSFRLLFGEYERVEYTKEELIKNDVEEDAVLKITDIGKKVGTIKLEFGDELNSFGYVWSYSDETSEYTRELPAKYYVEGEERTKYIPVYLSGETRTLELHQEKYNELEYIDKVVLNENIPIDFNFIRVGLVIFVLYTMYAIKHFEVFKQIYTKNNWKQEIVLLLVLLVAILILVWINVNSQNTFDEDFYAVDFVDAILNNQLYLEREPNENIYALFDPYDPIERNMEGVIRGKDYLWDTALYNKHLYVYFGILPLLLVYLPFHLITGTYVSTCIVVFGFSFISLILLKEIICKLYSIFFKDVPFKIVFFSNIILFAGSFMWYANGMARVYELAIVSGLCFVLAGINFILNSICVEKNKYKNIFFGSLCLALSVACRPTDLLASLIIVPYLLNLLIVNIKNFKNNKKSVFKLILSVAIPYLVIGGLLMWYNYVRFGNVFDFGTKYQLTINNMDKIGNRISAGIVGLIVNLFSIPSFNAVFPFLTHHNDLPIYYGNYYIENMIGGVFMLVPICFMNFLVFKAFKNYKNIKLKVTVFALIIVANIIAFASAMMAGSNQRYVIDYVWMLIISGLLIFNIIYSKLKTNEAKKILIKILGLITIVTLLLGIASGIITEENYFSLFSADEFYKTRYMICFWE